MSDTSASPLIFGIYPGGHTGTEHGRAVTVDHPVHIQEALNRLREEDLLFLIRGYLHYVGSLSAERAGSGDALAINTPPAIERYLHGGHKLDLVLCFRRPDLKSWPSFIRQAISRYSDRLSTLQITEEANVPNFAEVDGCVPHVREALVEGVIAAKEEIRRAGLDVQVGFSAALNFDPSDDFWPSLAALGGQPFLDALDYVGLDFFPDVFRPLAPDGSPGDIRTSVIGVLSHFRNVNLAAAAIPESCPIHITEHGWSTGPTRSYERQAKVIEMIVRTISEYRRQFNITHYEHFALRDADSANPDLFSQFGLLRDDYSPKPAFERYRQLIAELG